MLAELGLHCSHESLGLEFRRPDGLPRAPQVSPRSLQLTDAKLTTEIQSIWQNHWYCSRCGPRDLCDRMGECFFVESDTAHEIRRVGEGEYETANLVWSLVSLHHLKRPWKRSRGRGNRSYSHIPALPTQILRYRPCLHSPSSVE